MVYQYCFLIRKKEVSVWKYSNGELIPVRRNGLEVFDFEDEDDLWKWWKSISAIATDDPDEKIDICILADEAGAWSFEGFHIVEKSIWNVKLLSTFFCKLGDFGNIILDYEGKQIPIVTRKSSHGELFLFAYGHLAISKTKSLSGSAKEASPSKETENKAKTVKEVKASKPTAKPPKKEAHKEEPPTDLPKENAGKIDDELDVKPNVELETNNIDSSQPEQEKRSHNNIEEDQEEAGDAIYRAIVEKRRKRFKR